MMKLKHSYSDVTSIDGKDCARDTDCSAYDKDRESFACSRLDGPPTTSTKQCLDSRKPC